MTAALSGVDICGETGITFNNSPLVWQWEGYGLKLRVHSNTLPPGTEHCQLSINASISGHYQFPSDHYLVSAIFWFRCKPPCKLTRNITVELQHCACSHNTSRLKFVKAVCTQKQRPYTFDCVAGGSFSKHSSFGLLELNKFSGIGVVQEESEERDYLATLLYKEERLRRSGLCFHLYFVVTWNTIVHNKVCLIFSQE